MDLETTQNNVIAKLPLLKQGDYEMWKLRIEQYFHVQDYALWEVIEYGNSYKPVARTATNADGTSTSTIPGLVTTKEKAQKKNDVKARSMLLMALPNEHQLTLSQYKDAKTLFEAIQARFGRNKATKKTQKTLLKQMYENFSASSQESLDSISNRLQKIVSQLVILGENISQEDLNFKFLRSLPSELKVKRSVTSSSNSSSHNVAFVSTPGSTNEDNTDNVQDNTASTHVNTASTNNSTASLSDATVYAFLANQPNGSQVVHEDLDQIHEDDLEEMDLKWQLALLSLKARKFYQRTGKKIFISRSDTAGYDKSKVECFNCHKMGHFARECRGPRNQESRPRNQESRSRNQESSKRTMNVEDTSSKAMVAFDGEGLIGVLWLMRKSLPTWHLWLSQTQSLRVELNKSEFDLATYKRGLASVKEQRIFYKKNEVMLCDQNAILKRDASFRDSEINTLNIQIEKLKKEKESNQIKIDKFENASKSLDKLIGSQISDNNRKGVGYNAFPPLPAGLFAPPTIDLSSSGLKEFQQPKFEGYGVNVNKSVSENSLNEIKKNIGAPIIEDGVSDCDEDECEEMVSENVQHKSEPKPEQAKQPRKINENPRNNRTNWNEKKTQKLGVRRNFAPTAVLTKSGIVPISTARQRSLRAAAPLSVARPINTAALKLFEKRVTSAIGKQGINAVKSSACWVWRPKRNIVDHTSKNSRSYIYRQFDYVDPTGRLKEAHDVYYALKYDWKYLLHQTKKCQHIGKSKEVGTLRYLSLVVPLTKVGDEAVHKELGDRMERVATTASSLEAEQDSDNPTIYASFIKQFWTTATASTNVNGEVELTASIDGQAKTITEASLRRHLKLEDNGGITSLPNT
ncbi:putative ribonuclease H-like domain-containing protein [Tanacetum coccineum]